MGKYSGMLKLMGKSEAGDDKRCFVIHAES